VQIIISGSIPEAGSSFCVIYPEAGSPCREFIPFFYGAASSCVLKELPAPGRTGSFRVRTKKLKLPGYIVEI